MATAISRPNFGPMEDNIIICAKKTGNYPVDQPINVEPDSRLLFYQNGEDVGGRTILTANDKVFILNRKNVVTNKNKKLSTGLFSKEFKNVTIFWFYGFNETFRVADTVTTKKGYAGKYNFNVKAEIGVLDLDKDKFTEMLRATKIKTDRDKIIISKQVVRDIVRERVKGAMETILDGVPGHVFDGAQKSYPSDIKTLEAYLNSEIKKIGLNGKFHVCA